MQKILILPVLFISSGVLAGAPSTQCPAGYVELREPYAIIGNLYCESVNGVVPVEIEQPIYSCLVNTPQAVCTMFVPLETTYSDDTGDYQYTEPCALE